MGKHTRISGTLIWEQCARSENGRVLLTHTIWEIKVNLVGLTLKEEQHLYYGELRIGLSRYRGSTRF